MITNHEQARVFHAVGRQVEEGVALRLSEDECQRADALPLLYGRMWDFVRTATSNDSSLRVRVCVPEINRPALQETIPADLAPLITHVIPKNLGNMEIGPIFRILLEV